MTTSTMLVEHCTIEVSVEAAELATPAQAAAILRLVGTRMPGTSVRVWPGGFALPTGYLYFEQERGGHVMNGGIDVDGAVST